MKNFKFEINGNTYEVEIANVEGTLAEVEVNGKKYNVTLDKEAPVVSTPKPIVTSAKPKEVTPTKAAPVKTAPKPAAPKPSAPKETASSQPSESLSAVKAPLPGNILDVKVKEGDEVKKGDVLLVMEAMKMENNVMSDASGVVRTVKVSAGDTVLQNDVLVEIA